MKRSKQTKRALISSSLALVLCFVMLLGTTFAWFTDNASTSVNKVEAGTLDVQLLDANNQSLEGTTLSWQKAAGHESETVLWEPGATYNLQPITIKNNGNLALKYKVVISGIKGDAELNKAIAWTIKVGEDTYSTDSWISLKASESSNLTISGKMKESAGNAYQGKSIDDIAIRVYATQDTVETDSNSSDYDAGAANGWDGVVPATMPETLVVDGTNCTITIKDAAAFAYLSTLSDEWADLYTNGEGENPVNYQSQHGGVGEQYYYGLDWTVVLDADIDLNNQKIDPVRLTFGANASQSGKGNIAAKFEGNGHTIRNAVIVTDPNAENYAGLFAKSKCQFTNLKLDNIHVTGSIIGNSTAGVLAGSCDCSISNITITNSSVTGGKYTGGVIGYGYTRVTNCTLENVTVKGGYKIGGVIGYICGGSEGSNVTGNTLTNCTVNGMVDTSGTLIYVEGKREHLVGKVVGNYNCNGTCNNNSITNMTTSAAENIGEIESGKTVTEA